MIHRLFLSYLVSDQHSNMFVALAIAIALLIHFYLLLIHFYLLLIELFALRIH